MKTLYVGPEKVFANDLNAYPVYYEDRIVAFGFVSNRKVLPLTGEEAFSILALLELKKEKPEINWSL